MKIKYLGTSAFEGMPALFCRCATCERTRKAGGRNIRTRQQALLNGELLFDFCADTLTQAQRYGLYLDEVTDCLVTHAHCNHLYPEETMLASTCYSGEGHFLHFYAGTSGKELLNTYVDTPESNADVTEIFPGKEFYTSTGKYRVLPLRADHDKCSDPVFYAVEGEGKRLLYAHDTGIFPEEDYPLLEKFGRFDLVSLDCTGCAKREYQWGRHVHMNFDSCREVYNRLTSLGVADEKTVRVLSHFSHQGEATYDELREITEPQGFLIAYDGMEIEF